MSIRVTTTQKVEAREWMRRELDRTPNGHTMTGWTHLLKYFLATRFEVNATWNTCDRLRRRLVEELQEQDVPVVSVGKRVLLGTSQEQFAEAIKRHYGAAMGHLRAIGRISGARTREIIGELEKRMTKKGGAA